MRKKRTTRVGTEGALHEAMVPYKAPVSMVRTQIYLTRAEYDFLQVQSERRGEPMASVIRSFIDERMDVPADAWENNPMLRATPRDVDWTGHEDGATNAHHYVSGAPKSHVKVGGKWVEAPPLPDDYYDNPASAARYDEALRAMEEPA